MRKSRLSMLLGAKGGLAGAIVLLYDSQSEALTHPYLAHAWAERGNDLRVAARGQSRNSRIPA
jgi:hypothetical protein